MSPAVMSGQQARDAAQAAEIARSYQIQAEFAAFEKNKDAATHELLSRWQSVVDPGMYDLFDELGPTAAQVPAWQLYGASKATDLDTMVKVLRGRIPASKLINSDGDTSNLLGSSSDSLIFNPIAPCRIIDTRNTAAGIIPANGIRSFHLEADGLVIQGGAGACPGLPNFSHQAWAVNITVTGQAGNGWITVYPFGGTEPTSSTLNFSTGQWSLANGVNVRGCYNCGGGDINVHAYFSATHVIVDVVGYYSEAFGTENTTAITRFAGTGTSIAASGNGFANGGACPAGTTLIGGEVSHPCQEVAIGENERLSTTTWRAWMINLTGSACTVTVSTVCQDNPTIIP